MAIITTLLAGIFGLVSVGIEILMFFVIVRIVLMWRSISWLKPFDTAGQELVDAYVSSIERLWRRIEPRTFTSHCYLKIGLVVLLVLQTMVSTIMRVL